MRVIFLFVAIVLAGCATKYEVDNKRPTALVEFEYRKFPKEGFFSKGTSVFIFEGSGCRSAFFLGTFEYGELENLEKKEIQADGPVRIEFRSKVDDIGTSFFELIFTPKPDKKYELLFGPPSRHSLIEVAENGSAKRVDVTYPERYCKF